MKKGEKITKIAIETGDVDVYLTMLAVMGSFNQIIINNCDFPVNDKIIVAKTINLLLDSVGFGMMRFDMMKKWEINNIEQSFVEKLAFNKYLNINHTRVKFNDEIKESGGSMTFTLDLISGEVDAI